MSTGIVVYNGPSLIDGQRIVVVATGLVRPSKNVKTGPMVQVWFLLAGKAPVDGSRSGDDYSICGDCPLRGAGDGTLRTCYVRLDASPNTVWKQWRAGAYPLVSLDEAARIMRGRDVRLGAYGDPVAAPIDVSWALTERARMWTGYTHQWLDLSASGRAGRWPDLLMASVEAPEKAEQAMRLGWRPFLAMPEGDEMPDGAFLCPAVREDDPLSCVRCGACAGTKRRSVMPSAAYPALWMHGSGRKNYLRLMERGVNA